MNQDLTNQNFYFSMNYFFKKVNIAMKMLTKQYYRNNFTNLTETNISHKAFDFITYSRVT